MRARTAAATLGVLGATALVFSAVQLPWRSAETVIAAHMAAALAGRAVPVLGGTSILVVPPRSAAFVAVVTPACSSAASVLAITFLGTVMTLGSAARRARRVGAIFAAVAVVFAGNLVRIAASVLVGLAVGRSSLVLFHDWMGSMFSFVYTLSGFILMLYIVLPAGPRSAPRPVVRPPVPALRPEGPAAGNLAEVGVV